jgi:hypothetical protein
MFSGLYFFLSRLVYLALPVNLGELEPNFISYLFDLLVDTQAVLGRTARHWSSRVLLIVDSRATSGSRPFSCAPLSEGAASCYPDSLVGG